MFQNAFSFDGRIRRLEYGISFIVYVVAQTFVMAMIKSDIPFSILAFIPLFWFLWAQGSKRSHDLGHSGWFQLIPFYALWLIFIKGDDGINIYGLSPRPQTKLSDFNKEQFPKEENSLAFNKNSNGIMKLFTKINILIPLLINIIAMFSVDRYFDEYWVIFVMDAAIIWLYIFAIVFVNRYYKVLDFLESAVSQGTLRLILVVNVLIPSIIRILTWDLNNNDSSFLYCLSYSLSMLLVWSFTAIILWIYKGYKDCK
ncbi:DUF805 domain-containing protein [Paludibacter jiangxiensis]|uniref:DUF805 domain-containing protein n=1 Tax=Paludibacter jiangxiensis TaxID=681398 RepID=A0A161LDX9_9BACT|nr:DUF805 domain-containing protein [Paludibacter jiangxiensis]GAT62595.1 hypothetical protein PJIAN_2154 [Paludibacter jiangxiensis]